MGIFTTPNILQEVEQQNNKAFIQSINEVYFGRTPGINRVFNAFCDFRDKYVDESYFRGVKNLNVDHDKDLKIFCEECERQFGFESFSFIVRNSLTENMMTLPVLFHEQYEIPSKSNIKNWISMDKEGYHFTKYARASCIIIAYSEMLFDADLSNEEAFAIVLHEIGHNFQAFINGDMLNLSFATSILYVYQVIIDLYISLYTMNPQIVLNDLENVLLSNSRINRMLSKAFNNLTSDSTRNNIYSYYNFFSGLLSVPRTILTNIAIVPIVPLLGFLAGLSKWLSSFTNIVGLTTHTYGYLGEQMGDNFPSYYGFGKSRITSNLKSPSPWGPIADGLGNIPIIGHIYNFLLMPGEMLLFIGDEHPADIVRCKSVINSMKTDLDDPTLSPKLRAQLKKEIEESEKQIDEYLKKSENISDPHSLKIFYDKCLYASANGGFKYRTFRSIFNLDKGTQRLANDDLRESAMFNDLL
jgi:hypothetical protein